jgi:hypothetical protein
MGYLLTIGEAVFEYTPNEHRLRIDAQRCNHHSNTFSISYRGWEEMCKATGLQQLFYGTGWNRDLREYDYCEDEFYREEPLLHRPGSHAVLCRQDADLIRACHERYRFMHPNVKPGLHSEIANNLSCLLWLDYWVTWAVDHCERPVITNY